MGENIKATSLAKGINNLVERIYGNDILDIILTKIELKKAISSYAKKYMSKYGTIKVLGMSKPIPVIDIYTGVNVANSAMRHQFSNIESLEKIYLNEGFGGFSDKKNNQDGIKVANETQLLNVLGAPGSGKSTLLKRIGIEAITASNEGLYTHNLLPVLIELKLIKTKEPILFDFVLEHLIDYGFPEDKNTLEVMLKKGAFLFLFDGLDEVESIYIKGITEAISKFHNKFNENRYITTCRTAFYSNNFNNFTDVFLLDFDNKQIKRFAFNWFKSKELINEYDKFMKEITSNRNSSTYDLARTPLLLTFMCIVYSKTLSFPVNRASLYKKALETLLHDWLVEKQVSVFDAFKGLHVDLEILMLASLAGPMYENNKLFFQDHEIAHVFKSFLSEELNAPKNIDSKKLIKIIEQKQGVLVERTHGVFSFSHLTIHEYLAAYYFKENDKVEYLVKKYSLNNKWREVFLLLAGMGNAGKLIKNLCEQSNKLLANTLNFKKVCSWISDNVEMFDDPIRNMYIRFNYLHRFLVLGKDAFIPNTLNFNSRRLADDIAISINKLYKPDINFPKYSTIPDISENLLVDLSKNNRVYLWHSTEFVNVMDYLSIYNLILECKIASLSLGKKQWNNALNNFMNIP